MRGMSSACLFSYLCDHRGGDTEIESVHHIWATFSHLQILHIVRAQLLPQSRRWLQTQRLHNSIPLAVIVNTREASKLAHLQVEIKIAGASASQGA